MVEINKCKTLIISVIVVVFNFNISKAYQEFFIEDDDLCSSLNKREINLHNKEQSGLIITLKDATKFREHSTEWKDVDFICEFKVTVDEKYYKGIFAVIQYMFLRKNHITQECIDYIQYKAVTPLKTYKSKEFCGPSHISDFMSSKDNVFVEASVAIDVYIFISKIPLKSYSTLNLQIVFTSFKFCLQQLTSNDKWCSSNPKVHCIYKGFFNDGYVNCPYPGCLDEANCKLKIIEEPKTSSLIYSNQFIVITCLSVAFILGSMMLTIYYCSRHRCERISNNSNGRAVFTVQPEFIEMTTMASPPRYDDRPPPYDSLFPPTPAN